jgi:pSer/pThr/pTyr-binding forkhead associated (FHA) protein
VTSGPLAGSSIDVERELVIGRQAADVTIPDEELSRRHAAVRPVDQGVIVEDLGSLNGTYVDGERLTAPVTLTSDATIRVGRSELALSVVSVERTRQPEGAGRDERTRLAPIAPVDGPPPPTLESEPAPAEPESAEPEVVEPPAPAVDGPAPIPQPAVTRVRPVLQVDESTRVRPTPPVARDPGAAGTGAGSEARPQSALRRLIRLVFGR